VLNNIFLFYAPMCHLRNSYFKMRVLNKVSIVYQDFFTNVLYQECFISNIFEKRVEAKSNINVHMYVSAMFVLQCCFT